MSGTSGKSLDPPLQDAVLTDEGTHSQVWAGHWQNIADAITSSTTATTTNDNAKSTEKGYYVESVVDAPGVALTTNVGANVTFMDLDGGDWDVEGCISFNPAGTTRPTHVIAGVSTSFGGFDAIRTDINGVFVFGAPLVIGTGMRRRFSIDATAGTTRIYLVALATFTVSTMNASGILTRRRAR